MRQKIEQGGLKLGEPLIHQIVSIALKRAVRIRRDRGFLGMPARGHGGLRFSSVAESCLESGSLQR